MNELDSILKRVSGFHGLLHVEKIKIFGWYLQSIEENARFSGQDLLRCYDNAQVKRPANITKILNDLVEKKPPQLLRDRNGYYLERGIRESLDSLLGDREISVEVSKLISDLPESIPDLKERDFFSETLICYKHGAFRAAIVMMWNLAYSHFCDWILKNHMTQFNAQWPLRFSEQHKKSKIKIITNLEQFGELKESEVIEIARSAGLISQGIHKTLIEKLGKRNSAAHPSGHSFKQLQTEEFVHDLVTNVMQKLA